MSDRIVVVVHNKTVTGALDKVLVEMDIRTFTRIPAVYGMGTTADPHFDTTVWPGVNEITFTALPDQVASEFLDSLKGLKSEYGKEGVKAFVLGVNEII